MALAGTVQHEGNIYSIRRVRGGLHTVAIVEMNDDRMPPDHAPMPSRLRTNDPNLRDDPLVQQGDASVLRSLVAGMRPRSATAPKGRDESRREQETVEGETVSPVAKEITINLMVAYTKRAASNYADVRRELVEFAIEEANQSFRNSNLGYVKLKLVHTYQTGYEEEGTHFDHLWRFADKGDPYMEEAHGLRDKYDADVAVLIVDDPKGCGLATRVFSDAEDAFAVVHYECAVAAYSVAHEIGHLVGARHELQTDSTMTPFPYGHGYVNGTKWRDIMSYKQSCGGCPRLPVWSSPKVMIRGEPAGTQDQDNARVIAEQAARVANFRSSRNVRGYSAEPLLRPSVTGTGDRALGLK